MNITISHLKQLIRESLKDFFDAQDAGDWGKYDKAINKQPSGRSNPTDHNEPISPTNPRDDLSYVSFNEAHRDILRFLDKGINEVEITDVKFADLCKIFQQTGPPEWKKAFCSFFSQKTWDHYRKVGHKKYLIWKNNRILIRDKSWTPGTSDSIKDSTGNSVR